ncbi:unnamed protein product [Polarella glacialis]|uniref:Beta-galactosidase n=1 Tax=Polarella glacialis TaxID=89957 RepID=A0A813IMA9_POLGL|nr:unnamed protein product [Polarella glacialis]
MGLSTSALLVVLQAHLVSTQYPAPVAKPTWCSVPNYRFYRWTPTKARGFAPSADLHCGLQEGKPDGCSCVGYKECRSGCCVPDITGATYCTYPIIQVAEIEFWRKSQKVRTQKVPDNNHDAFRVMSSADVPQTWGVWELELYRFTNCSGRLVGGTAISSSSRSHGFGHSIDHAAPYGLHETPRTYWQDDPSLPKQSFELHGPEMYAVDGDQTTNWYPTCQNPCLADTQWVGLNFSTPMPGGVKCVRILQDKDRAYASFGLRVQGHRHDTGAWETLASFNAATWEYGGVWENLSIPQGVSFYASRGHARSLDSNLSSSVVELVGTPLEFDFGVETEIDAWRFAPAKEPSENNSAIHDGYTCENDGLCARDPVQWKLDGSLDRTNWVTLTAQDTADYDVPIFRQAFTPFFSVDHLVSLTINDIWPDGRGKCAARR